MHALDIYVYIRVKYERIEMDVDTQTESILISDERNEIFTDSNICIECYTNTVTPFYNLFNEGQFRFYRILWKKYVRQIFRKQIHSKQRYTDQILSRKESSNPKMFSNRYERTLPIPLSSSV